MSTEANTILRRVETHCGAVVESKRLRFHIIETLQRELDKHTALQNSVTAVLQGAKTYDANTHKPIRRSTAQ